MQPLIRIYFFIIFSVLFIVFSLKTYITSLDIQEPLDINVQFFSYFLFNFDDDKIDLYNFLVNLILYDHYLRVIYLYFYKIM